MSETTISLIQDKSIHYLVRQGVQFEIEIEWLENDGTAKDISDATFLSQLKDNYAAEDGALIVNFTETPDDAGNVLVIDVPTAKTTFKVSAVTAAALTAEKTYYFESKMLNDDDEPVDSFQLTLTAKKDVARVIV